MDAPPNNEDGSRVLRSISEISGKDQSVAMDSDFIPIGERGYLTMLGMQSGTNESDYSFSRRKDNTAMGDITWRRNKLLRDEVSFKNALISGTNPMINGDTVKVHPDDPTVGAVTSHLIRRNGGTVSEVCRLVLIRHSISSNLFPSTLHRPMHVIEATVKISKRFTILNQSRVWSHLGH